jgi:hypothetical protein
VLFAHISQPRLQDQDQLDIHLVLFYYIANDIPNNLPISVHNDTYSPAKKIPSNLVLRASFLQQSQYITICHTSTLPSTTYPSQQPQHRHVALTHNFLSRGTNAIYARLRNNTMLRYHGERQRKRQYKRNLLSQYLRDLRVF